MSETFKLKELVMTGELRKFHNRLRILRSIDSFEVSKLSEKLRFVMSPFEYFIRCSDQDAEIIFKALLKRENPLDA